MEYAEARKAPWIMLLEEAQAGMNKEEQYLLELQDRRHVDLADKEQLVLQTQEETASAKRSPGGGVNPDHGLGLSELVSKITRALPCLPNDRQATQRDQVRRAGPRPIAGRIAAGR
jgi:hypothetical protein